MAAVYNTETAQVTVLRHEIPRPQRHQAIDSIFAQICGLIDQHQTINPKPGRSDQSKAAGCSVMS
jgi:hypothetical protein